MFVCAWFIIFGSIALYWAAFSAFCALLSSHMTNKDDDDDDVKICPKLRFSLLEGDTINMFKLKLVVSIDRGSTVFYQIGRQSRMGKRAPKL